MPLKEWRVKKAKDGLRFAPIAANNKKVGFQGYERLEDCVDAIELIRNSGTADIVLVKGKERRVLSTANPFVEHEDRMSSQDLKDWFGEWSFHDLPYKSPKDGKPWLKILSVAPVVTSDVKLKNYNFAMK